MQAAGQREALALGWHGPGRAFCSRGPRCSRARGRRAAAPGRTHAIQVSAESVPLIVDPVQTQPVPAMDSSVVKPLLLGCGRDYGHAGNNGSICNIFRDSNTASDSDARLRRVFDSESWRDRRWAGAGAEQTSFGRLVVVCVRLLGLLWTAVLLAACRHFARLDGPEIVEIHRLQTRRLAAQLRDHAARCARRAGLHRRANAPTAARLRCALVVSPARRLLLVSDAPPLEGNGVLCPRLACLAAIGQG